MRSSNSTASSISSSITETRVLLHQQKIAALRRNLSLTRLLPLTRLHMDLLNSAIVTLHTECPRLQVLREFQLIAFVSVGLKDHNN